MVIINTEAIKSQIIDFASKHLIYTLNGDYKGANKMQANFLKVYKKIKKINRQDIFEDLIDYDNDGVKLWAATGLLKTNPELAISCLNKLTKLPTITSMDAKMTLDLWKKGELELL